MSFAALFLLAATPPKRTEVWAQKPTSEEVAAVWPVSGAAAGWVSLQCVADDAGRLHECSVDDEGPTAAGFGAAGLKMIDQVIDKPAGGRNRTIVLAFETDATGRHSVDFGQFLGPDWLKKPTMEDMHAHWPYRAVVELSEGAATISCTVALTGKLTNCKVDREEPAGYGYGEAALAMAPYFMMRPASMNGRPIEAKVKIPFRYGALDKATAKQLLAQNPSAGLPAASDIAWELGPSFADMSAAYPAKAAHEAQSGYVALDCLYGSDGGVSDCRSLRESPPGEGFATAALSLTTRFKGPPTDRSGKPLSGARVRIDVRFSPEQRTTQVPIVLDPPWVASPSAEDFKTAFTAAAFKANVPTVRAAMQCRVAPGGVLEGCALTTEEPAGVGLGQALLGLSSKFRMSGWDPRGRPTLSGAVRVGVRYNFQTPAAAPPNP